MTSLQEEARALGDPTRHRIFRFVVDAARPVGIAELTDHLGLNHNAIRQHLNKLSNAGLVVQSTAASGRPGRPRLEYTASPSADSRWGGIGPYQRLSLLLTEIISSGDTPVDVGRRAGRRLRITTDADDVANVSEALDRQGFEPEVVARRDGADIVLGTCPFEAAAVQDRDTVCGLHLGIAEGLVDGTGLAVSDLAIKDPRRAGCRIRLRSETT
ncbi:helix-turn-helix transcriptional regulator [Actinospongicola halichondriae]|uniref:helix-turn-helix transcriptional regulator n=1 Tax=Actinospongicola halichondriae TaxID=3236844 RepID=UPI003D494CA4